MLRVSLQILPGRDLDCGSEVTHGGDRGWQRDAASKSILIRPPHGIPLAVIVTVQHFLDPSHWPSWVASFPVDTSSLPSSFQ